MLHFKSTLFDWTVVPAMLAAMRSFVCPYNGAAWKTGKGKGQTKTNALIVDERLRVCGLDNVFALGDCAMEPQRLPQTAQVASQEGKWLGQYQLYLCCFSSWLQPCTASKP
jgi:hypothetical protein